MDDAAAIDIGNSMAILSTTDFFMPIVDDAYLFGQIASVNAINDIYAMGGRPLMALGILGWPIDKIPASEARRVIEGARKICHNIGIPLAGGHSIDNPEPIFGLAVTGLVHSNHIKKNEGATEDCLLYLTKPLGIGILTTALKRGLLDDNMIKKVQDIMLILNDFGANIGNLPGVKSMTDVTGFGLMGHLSELCTASNVNAVVDFNKIGIVDHEVLTDLVDRKIIPGGTKRNYISFGENISPLPKFVHEILYDPQTSGGLLIAVAKSEKDNFEEIARNSGLELEAIGYLTAENADAQITVKY